MIFMFSYFSLINYYVADMIYERRKYTARRVAQVMLPL